MIMFLKLSENLQHYKQLKYFHKSFYKHMNSFGFAIMYSLHICIFLLFWSIFALSSKEHDIMGTVKIPKIYVDMISS